MKRKINAALFLIFLTGSVAGSYYRKTYLADLIEDANQSVLKLSNQFSQETRVLQTFMQQTPNAIYLAGVWSPNDYKSGYLNQENLKKSPATFKRFFQDSKWDTFEKTLDPQANLASDYVHVVHVHYQLPSPNGAALDLGEIKAAFLLPGALFAGVPMGRGFSYPLGLMWLLTAFFGGWMARSILKPSRTGSRKLPLPPYIDDEDDEPSSELTWLETDTGVTQPVYVDERGRSWSVLFPTPLMHQWSSKGSYYIRDHQLVLKPWGTSVVRPDIHPKGSFEFLARGFKLAGPDSFVVTFTFNKHNLYWVVGGWNNTRSELAGYPSTNSAQSLTVNTWHLFEIKLRENNLEGYVNGEKSWRIAAGEINKSSPDVGFEKGFGVAVWNSLSKYTDIRLLSGE